MNPTPAVDALRAALRALAPRARTLATSDTDRLRRRVCEAVQELKHYELPAERVVIVVKQLANDAGFGRAGDTIFDQMVAWCIEEYFGSRPRQTPPQRA